jgi:type VI secretion system protein VasG
MASIDIRALIQRLNPLCRTAFEQAAKLAVDATNFSVEVEHVLDRLMDPPGSDVDEILRAYGVDPARLRGQLQRAMAGFKTGAGRTPAFAPAIHPLLADAWMIASLGLGEERIRSGAILAAAMDDEPLRTALVASLPSLSSLQRDRLRADLPALCAAATLERGAKVERIAVAASATPPKSSALAAYTVDLTAQARDGRLDPIIGRDGEIRQVIDILLRRRQNNPILTGEAGVGKTAVVEGLALRVVAGEVPPPLADVTLLTLDLGLLQAGAGQRGEFEQRLTQVVDEVRAALHPIILFIDEAHTLIGAGAAEGSGDAANLLKPALARGELRTIAATTWAEYKRSFETDPALARRFQPVRIDEPDGERAIAMLRAVVPRLEAHHRVRIRDEAVRGAVLLSQRYLPDRRLPDKAVAVLDTACARAVLSRSAPPAEVEALAHTLTTLDHEITLLWRDGEDGGVLDGDRLDTLADQRSHAADGHIALSARWRREVELVERLDEVRARLANLAGAERIDAEDDRRRTGIELAELRQGHRLVPESVDGEAVAEIVSGWTGIPIGRIMTDQAGAMLDLSSLLRARIVGQDGALELIARHIRAAGAGLAERDKPPAVFLLTGPSGVGKTETALALAELLHGDSSRLVTVNMSEYQEAHSVSKLKGAPPGYVGYGKGGVLTEAIRRRPYAVLLLDEIEKAHGDVVSLFYQVFDKGVLEDSDGQPVSFRNVTILLTSNLGADTLAEACPAEPEALARLIWPELRARLAPAFLGRLTVVPYLPLGDARLADIVRMKLARLQARFGETHGGELTYDAELAHRIAARCQQGETGARAIDDILNGTVLPVLSQAVLERMALGEPITTAHLCLDGAGGVSIRLR